MRPQPPPQAALALGIGLPAVQQAADGDRQVDVTDDPDGPSVPGTVDTTMPDRLFAGDIEGAYGLLDDTSLAAMPLEEFELLGSGLFEGAAAFAGEDVARSVLQVETAAGFVSVVSFSGDVAREGMIETAAYPVVLTETGVHFTLQGDRLVARAHTVVVP